MSGKGALGFVWILGAIVLSSLVGSSSATAPQLFGEWVEIGAKTPAYWFFSHNFQVYHLQGNTALGGFFTPVGSSIEIDPLVAVPIKDLGKTLTFKFSVSGGVLTITAPGGPAKKFKKVTGVKNEGVSDSLYGDWFITGRYPTKDSDIPAKATTGAFWNFSPSQHVFHISNNPDGSAYAYLGPVTVKGEVLTITPIAHTDVSQIDQPIRRKITYANSVLLDLAIVVESGYAPTFTYRKISAVPKSLIGAWRARERKVVDEQTGKTVSSTVADSWTEAYYTLTADRVAQHTANLFNGPPFVFAYAGPYYLSGTDLFILARANADPANIGSWYARSLQIKTNLFIASSPIADGLRSDFYYHRVSNGVTLL